MKKIIIFGILILMSITFCSCDASTVANIMNSMIIESETSVAETEVETEAIIEESKIIIPENIVINENETVIETDGIIVIYPKETLTLNYYRHNEVYTTFTIDISNVHYIKNWLSEGLAFSLHTEKTFETTDEWLNYYKETGLDCSFNCQIFDETDKRIVNDYMHTVKGLLTGGKYDESPAMPETLKQGHIYRLIFSDYCYDSFSHR